MPIAGRDHPKRSTMNVDPQSLFCNGPLRLKQCRHGPMLYLETDRYIGRALDHYGEFSEAELQLLKQIVQPGHTVLDIGANIGVHTIFLAQLVGPGGRVFAFEPQRLIFELLCANVALNRLPHVFVRQAAIGRESSTVKVPYLDPEQLNNFGGLSMQSTGEGECVPMLKLDELVLDSCHLLKIDVEGMERDVLAGGAELIKRCRPFIYVENDRDENSEELIRQLLSMDYRLYWHIPPMFRRENYFGVSEDVLGGIVSINILAIPSDVSHCMKGFREILSPQDNWRE